MPSNPQLNWRRALVLTLTVFLIGSLFCWSGLTSSGVAQIVLLAFGTIFLFLSFAGVYVTLVRRYYYKRAP